MTRSLANTSICVPDTMELNVLIPCIMYRVGILHAKKNLIHTHTKLYKTAGITLHKVHRNCINYRTIITTKVYIKSINIRKRSCLKFEVVCDISCTMPQFMATSFTIILYFFLHQVGKKSIVT